MFDCQHRIKARFRQEFPTFDLDVDLDLPSRGVTALFGHSGSGKTTLLRCIAGLTRSPEGYFSLGEQVWQNEQDGVFLPTYRRSIGVVFQEASLFPHLSVTGNLHYGLKRAGLTQQETDLDSIVEMLGIGDLLQRNTQTLSGGERQRVAIARSLVRRPQLLLMDEPLAALDQKRKYEILPYLERLRDELDIPIFYVSHSLDEVVRLADHLVLMEQGRAIAQGSLSETLRRLDLVSNFGDDVTSVFTMTVGSHEDDHLTRLDFSGGSIYVGQRSEAIGKKLRIQVQAKDVSLSLSQHSDMSIVNILAAMVLGIEDAPESGHRLVEISLMGGEKLVSRISRRSEIQLGIRPHLLVWAQIKAVTFLGN